VKKALQGEVPSGHLCLDPRKVNTNRVFKYT